MLAVVLDMFAGVEPGIRLGGMVSTLGPPAGSRGTAPGQLRGSGSEAPFTFLMPEEGQNLAYCPGFLALNSPART